MSGQVPPSSRAGARRRARSDAERAGLLYEKFTGHQPEAIAEIDLPEHPAAVMVIGELDAVQYTTVRDGRVEHYEHRFAHKDKPLLCASPDGKQLWIVGGRYDMTERGIVDGSDRKTRRELRMR